MSFDKEKDSLEQEIRVLITKIRSQFIDLMPIFGDLPIQNIGTICNEKFDELETLFESKNLSFYDSMLFSPVYLFLITCQLNGKVLLEYVDQNIIIGEKNWKKKISKNKKELDLFQTAMSCGRAMREYEHIAEYCTNFSLENNLEDIIEYYMGMGKELANKEDAIDEGQALVLFNDELKTLGINKQLSKDTIPDTEEFQKDFDQKGFAKKYIIKPNEE